MSIIDDGEIQLSDIGEAVQDCWLAIPQHFGQVELGQYIIMPNHIHAILLIHDISPNPTDSVGAKHVSPKTSMTVTKTTSVSTIIGSFKAAVTRIARKNQLTRNVPLWQRGFYDHIIRNQDDAHRIAQYILDNPLKWESDDYY